jgi:hypothetical protein
MKLNGEGRSLETGGRPVAVNAPAWNSLKISSKNMTDLSPTGIRTGYDLNIILSMTRMLDETTVGCSFLLCGTWNLWIVGSLSRLEAFTSGMRVGALCKSHSGIGFSLGSPKHTIHVLVATLSCISSDLGSLHPVMFASCGFAVQDYTVMFVVDCSK